ncbi:MAG: hypothetical protein J0H81_07265 [Sphingopyxis terrae]|nr:hypothetical protein [Sphingopyxis terrae]
MPLKTAQSLAWSLAKTLMTTVVLVRMERGGFAVMPWDEFDGNPADVVREYDPFPT